MIKMFTKKGLQRRYSSSRGDGSPSVLSNFLNITKATRIDLCPFLSVGRRATQAVQLHTRTIKPLTESLSPISQSTEAVNPLSRPASSFEGGLLGERLGTKVAYRRNKGPTVVVKVRNTHKSPSNRLKKGLSWLELPLHVEKIPHMHKKPRSKSNKLLKGHISDLAIRSKELNNRAKSPANRRKILHDLSHLRSRTSSLCTLSVDKTDQSTECCFDPVY